MPRAQSLELYLLKSIAENTRADGKLLNIVNYCSQNYDLEEVNDIMIEFKNRGLITGYISHSPPTGGQVKFDVIGCGGLTPKGQEYLKDLLA